MNPLAVEIAAREGARTVWLPTVDSLNEMTGAHEIAPGAKPPVWMRLQQELRDQGVHIEPVRVVDDGGALLPETRAVLDAVARHGMVLATGHLDRDEIFAVVDAAVEKGVETIVVTHPEFPAQDLGARGPGARWPTAARCSSAASRRRTPARSPGSACSRRSAPRAPSTRCSPPTSARSSTRPSRTGWR